MTRRENAGTFSREITTVYKRKKPPAEVGKQGVLRDTKQGDIVSIDGRYYQVTMVTGPSHGVRRVADSHQPVEFKPRNTKCTFVQLRP